MTTIDSPEPNSLPSSNFERVLEFHQVMGAEIDETIFNPRNRSLRLKLIQEELFELRDACEAEDLAEIADALADLAYVVYGAAVSFGIDLDSVFLEVHRSNMTKTPGNKREDGKILKGDNFEPPQLEERIIYGRFGY